MLRRLLRLPARAAQPLARWIDVQWQFRARNEDALLAAYLRLTGGPAQRRRPSTPGDLRFLAEHAAEAVNLGQLVAR